MVFVLFGGLEGDFGDLFYFVGGVVYGVVGGVIFDFVVLVEINFV